MSERRKRGEETMARVYGDVVPVPPEGFLDFADLMVNQLFAEVWSREEQLSIRDRRLVTMGVIAAMGETDTFVTQVKAALTNDELDPTEVREILIQLAQYAGYPRAAALLGPVETAIHEVTSTEPT